MSATVTLTVTMGSLVGTEFMFDAPGEWVVGRSPECDLRVPNCRTFATTSRRHCMFMIEPPLVWVQDLGSRNGTFINGQRIGRCEDSETSDAVGESVQQHFPLHDGDEVRIGSTILRIVIATTGSDGSDPALNCSTLRPPRRDGDLVQVPIDSPFEVAAAETARPAMMVSTYQAPVRHAREEPAGCLVE